MFFWIHHLYICILLEVIGYPIGFAFRFRPDYFVPLVKPVNVFVPLNFFAYILHPVSYPLNPTKKISASLDPFAWILDPLGTGQYLWEYGTGKFATGSPVILILQLNGATGYFEGWLYGATAYFNVGFHWHIRYLQYRFYHTGQRNIFSTDI